MTIGETCLLFFLLCHTQTHTCIELAHTNSYLGTHRSWAGCLGKVSRGELKLLSGDSWLRAHPGPDSLKLSELQLLYVMNFITRSVTLNNQLGPSM